MGSPKIEGSCSIAISSEIPVTNPVYVQFKLFESSMVSHHQAKNAPKDIH